MSNLLYLSARWSLGLCWKYNCHK